MQNRRYQHVPNVPMHEGHNPFDPRVFVVEDLAMVQCAYCGDGRMRWRDHNSPEWCHQPEWGDEAEECDANSMLNSALELGIPIYTGSELEFPAVEENE